MSPERRSRLVMETAGPSRPRRTSLCTGAIAALALASALGTTTAGCKRAQPPHETPAAPAPVPVPAPAPVPVTASPPAPTPAVTVNAETKPALFHVQVAATPEERANGLVGRPTLAADTGILFIFDRLERQSVSTKDNQLATDLIFIGADRRIVGLIEGTRPLGTTPYRIQAPSRYVLGIRGGLSARLGFKVGQSVELRAIPGT